MSSTELSATRPPGRDGCRLAAAYRFVLGNHVSGLGTQLLMTRARRALLRWIERIVFFARQLGTLWEWFSSRRSTVARDIGQDRVTSSFSQFAPIANCQFELLRPRSRQSSSILLGAAVQHMVVGVKAGVPRACFRWHYEALDLGMTPTQTPENAR